MIAILSPAKNLDFDKTLKINQFTIPAYIDQSAKLIQGLKKLSPKKIGELMNISPKLAELNYNRFQQWNKKVLEPGANARQAVFAFNGEVYNGLKAETFTEKDIDFAQNHLIILSGLYGALKPLDVIQPYRLEMGSSFGVGKAKNLYQFWTGDVSAHLNKELKTHCSRYLINLASNEYSKVVDFKKFKYPVITFHFKEEINGELKSVMMYAKKARGLMARYMIENKIDEPDKLKGFNAEGYLFSDNLSDEKNWYFTRLANK